MRYKHIVFDVDGTLLDTAQTSLTCLQRVFWEVLHREVPMEELQPLFGIPCKEIAQMYQVPDVDDVVARWQKYDREEKTKVSLFPGVREVLEKLSQRNLILGIVTSRSRQEIEEQIPFFHLESYFEVFISSDDTDRRKPFPDPLLKYMEITGGKKDEILYIGDSKHDMECAWAAGIDGGLAGWGAVLTENNHAKYCFREPMDVLHVLEENDRK